MLFQNHLHVRRAIHVVASLSLVCSLCLPPAAAAADDQARTGQPAAGSPQVTAFSLSESAEGQESAQPATQADTLPDVVSIQSNASTTTAEVAIDWGKTDNADAATVTATLSYQGTVMRTVTANFERTSGEASETFTMDFENYGKFEVKVQFKKGGALVGDAVSTTAAIYADTYNIAPVSATLPVTFFSLNLWGEGNIRESGPVILLMERPSAYNWDALPSGMYGLPYLSTEDLTTQPDVAQAGWTFIGREEIMADYVHDLLAMNPDSQINLYCVDVYTDLIQRIIYANQIPQDQYRIVVISDGSATYASFEKSYKRNGKTPSQNHADFVKRWTDDKEYAYANGKAAKRYSKADGSAAFGFGDLFWAAVDSEPNAQLWVARKDLLKTTNDDNAFGELVQANEKVVQLNIGSLLATNIQSSDAHTAAFKELYNFNDGYFAEAQESGKDAMVFLGSRVNMEQDFVNYAAFVQTYYGDAYAYYYKGHPATPTGSYPEKEQQLEKLGITDVDSSIAAELILFFNPEIYLSGYASSTYASVPKGMGKGMFNMSKATGTADPLYQNMDFWMTKVGATTPAAAKELCVAGHANYLVEFSDAVAKKEGYDIAIWDATAPKIIYYKQRADGSYQRIGGPEERAVAEGTYVLQTTLANGQVVEVAGGVSGNVKDKANVHIYRYNNTPAQQWRISYDRDNYATLVNAKSGKALEVATNTLSNKANVRQGNLKNTLAQKWCLLRNADGTLTIASAIDDTFVLHVASSKAANNTNVQLYRTSGAKAQKFFPLPVKPALTTSGQANLANGCYYLSPSKNAAFVVDMPGYQRANGTNVQIDRAAHAANQLLRIEKQASGFYHISNAWSGKALDMTNGAIVTGTNVQFYNAVKAHPNQQWKITRNSNGTYKFTNVASGLVLDLVNNHTAAGTNVQGHIDCNAPAQQWVLKAATDPHAALDALAAANRSALANGTYTIRSASDASLVFDVCLGSLANRADVRLWKHNGTPAQKWRITHDAKGYVTFVNVKSGKAIDVADGIPKKWNNVFQYASNGTYAQKWVVVPQANGSHKIVSALFPNIVLDIRGGTIRNATTVQVFTDNDTAAQRFTFAKTA